MSGASPPAPDEKPQKTPPPVALSSPKDSPPMPDSADGGKLDPPPAAPQAKKSTTLKELIAMQFFRGPLPSPLMLTKYEEAIPGLGAKLVRWTEEEAAHRRKLEVRNQLIQVLGMGCGFMIGIAGLVAATVMAWKGHGVAAAIVGSVDLVGLVGLFVLGRRLPQRRQRNDDDNDDGDDDDDHNTSEVGIAAARTRTSTTEPPSKG